MKNKSLEKQHMPKNYDIKGQLWCNFFLKKEEKKERGDANSVSKKLYHIAMQHLSWTFLGHG